MRTWIWLPVLAFGDDLRCDSNPRKRRRWSEVRDAISAALEDQINIPKHVAVLADSDPDECPLGRASLHLLGAFALPRELHGRRGGAIRRTLRAIWRRPWVDILASGWPIFALLSFHARSARLSWNATAPKCPAEVDELVDDLNVKVEKEGHVPVRERYRDAMLRFREIEVASCELGGLLPLAAWAASLQCHARRSTQILAAVGNAVGKLQRHRDPLIYLGMGRYATIFFMLLERIAGAFRGLVAPLSVSYDPLEARMHARGIHHFVQNVFNATGFEIVPGLPCAAVWVARDQFPPYGYSGLTVYVDQEAGLSTGRQVGSLEHLNQRSVMYLGIQNPMTRTQCGAGTETGKTAGRRLDRPCVCVHVEQPSLRVKAIGPGMLLPFASTSFAERVMNTPSDLATTTRNTDVLSRTRRVAYLASTCVAHRERLFDLLVDLFGPFVDALGDCSGRYPERHVGRESTRRVGNFMDESVELLRGYQFVIAFENKFVEGYVTEKIVSAFLAGAIPIYWGSDTILDMFNSDAFIFANRLMPEPASRPVDGLERVAEEVLRIASDNALLARMASAPILSDIQRATWFSWHHSLLSSATPTGVDPLSKRIRDQVLDRIGAHVSVEELCGDGSDGRLCTKKVRLPTFESVATL